MKPRCIKPNCSAITRKIMGIEMWICDRCANEETAEREQKARQREIDQFENAWNAICPPLYRDTDISRLNDRQRKEIARWDERQNRGAIHTGKTGIGKSRSGYECLRAAYRRNADVKAIRATMFGTELGALFSKSSSLAKDLIDSCVSVDLLMIDDFGKGKLTERVESELFSIIDERMIHLRPTIITANVDLEAFAGLWSPDRKDPMMRRVLETMEIIT